MSTWDQREEFQVELYLEDNKIYDDWDDELPKFIADPIRAFMNEHNVDFGVISVIFRAQGCYYPAQTYGPPENCYPEEYDEERTPESYSFICWPDKKAEMPFVEEKAKKLIWDMYEENIYDVEISTEYETEYGD